MEDQQHDTVTGTVDYKGRPALRSKHGRWKSSCFLIWVEVVESIVFYGISGNLINFLTKKLGQSTAAAAANINAWKGVGCMLYVLGASIADTYLGKYYTIVASSVIYILGLGLLTISAGLPSLTKGSPGRPHVLQKVIFFVALYMVNVGRGGHEPCIQAFGADQFDGKHPRERKAKSSFFNWWSFGISVGALLGLGLLSYVQDDLSWGLGYGIPCAIMVIALVIFLFGSMTYRYTLKVEGESPFKRIGRVFVRAARNRNATFPVHVIGDEEAQQPQPRQLRFLDKALLAPNEEGNGKACSESEVEEAKAVLRLIPIWAITFIFAIVYAQHGTLVTKQGVTLDRKIGSNFTIPAASLQCVMDITILISVPLYDYMIVPTARKVTGKPAGISMLQRVGIGLFLSIITMVVSAVIENKRLKTASRHGLIDSPDATVPMSFWWLVPQYVLFGMTDFCTMTGLQEFFYDQVPNELGSVGLALYASILGLGDFLSSFLISFINKATRRRGDSWISDNLNRSHLDYFYWLLAGLSSIELVLFIYFAKSYIYDKNKARQ